MRTIVIATAAMMTSSVAAQQPLPPSSALMDTLVACRGVVESAARLACYDRAAGAMAAARTRGDVLVVDRGRVVARKQQRFGLAGAAGDAFGGGAEDRTTTVTRIDTTIVAARQLAGERWTMELANGSVWQTVEPVRRTPARGLAIVVTKASLGGFRAAIAGSRSVLVKRLR